MSEVEHPRSLEEALALRARHTDAVAIAGGTDLMVAVNGGRQRPSADDRPDRRARAARLGARATAPSGSARACRTRG